MKQSIGPLASGFVFAIGLGISGMTHPERIIGFLDFTGAWDPTLAFVMLGAIAVHAPLQALIRRRTSPLWEPTFLVPTRRDVDRRLLAGASLFGIGWGLGGLCPGPAIVSLLSGAPMVIVFVLGMLAGMAAFERLGSVRGSGAPARSPS